MKLIIIRLSDIILKKIIALKLIYFKNNPAKRLIKLNYYIGINY